LTLRSVHATLRAFAGRARGHRSTRTAGGARWRRL